MDRIIKAKLNNEIKEFNVLLTFTSKKDDKKYIVYTNFNDNKILFSHYRVENDLYILTPVTNENEVQMCLDIIKTIMENKNN